MANENASVVLKPCEEPLNLPAPAITSQWAPVLCCRPHAVRSVRSDHLDAYVLKAAIEPVTIIGHIADDPFWKLLQETVPQQPINERYFVGRSTFDAYGDRKTSAVCNCHDLGPLAALGFPDAAAPFFRRGKCAVDEASLQVDSAALAQIAR